MSEQKKSSTTADRFAAPPSQRAARRLPMGFRIHLPFVEFWPSVVTGIALFGAPWPFFLYLLNLFHPDSVTSLFAMGPLEMLFAGVVSLLFGGTICFFVLGILAGGVAVALSLVAKTLGVDDENPLAAKATGGFVGFLLALPSCFTNEPGYGTCLLMIATATFLTQLGGVWGANCALAAASNETSETDQLARPWQFEMRHLMLGTVWFAVVLTMLKLAGLLNERLLVMFGIWVGVFAVFLLAPALYHRLRQVQQSATQKGEP